MPKTYQANGKKIVEFTYEDWEEGVIAGNIRPGRRPIIDKDKNDEIYYELISHTDYEKIEKRRKELYHKKIWDQFEWMAEDFTRKYTISGNKERLIKMEISDLECLFFVEKRIEKSKLPSRFSKCFGYAELYDKIIVQGRKEYQFTNSPASQISIGIGDYHRIRVETFARYLFWLKETVCQPQAVKVNGELFSIDTRKLKFKDVVIDNLFVCNHENQIFSPNNKFDLPNQNVYDWQGNIVQPAEESDNDFSFATKLSKIYPIYKSIDFLEHHFANTNRKKLLLKHIEHHILLFQFLKNDQRERCSLIREWIRDKEKDLGLPQSTVDPSFDSNMWDERCYKLFLYLEHNYQKTVKHRFVYYWFFLRELHKKNYDFRASRKQYKAFVEKVYGKVLNNFNRNQTYYDDRVVPALNDLRIQFEEGLK